MGIVEPLSSLGAQDLARAGGKGANLGELVRAGFPVPAGFVVTVEAAAAVSPSDFADLAALRDAVASAPMDPEVRAAIGKAYAGLGGGAVAVRSSATAEDLPGAAFAGQQDTVLNVVGEDAVLDAVRRCWVSLWTDRAVDYRRRRGVDIEGLGIAVVVQTMVDADTAGVMLTADPVTGRRDRIVVDASPGLGEAVVSGRVTPDHWELDPDGAVVEHRAGRREVVITAVAGGGVREDGPLPAIQGLSPDDLRELASLGTRVAAHFGRPQDIEWARADGRIQLVQARPLTALPPPPIRLGPAGRRIGSILLEYLPVRPYPIDMTTWLSHGPAAMMTTIAARIGIRGVFTDFLHEQDGVVDRLVPGTPRPTPALLLLPFRMVRWARHHDPARWREDPRFAAFLVEIADLAALDLATVPWRELLRLPRRALAEIGPITDLRTDYLPRTGLALLRLLLVLVVLGRRDLLGELLAGARTRTADANRALEELAAAVRADPSLRAAVEQLDPARLPAGDFTDRFVAFLAEYGHRETATPLLVTPPTWGEAPETVLGIVSVLAHRAPSPTTDTALATLFRRLPGRARPMLTRWVEAARAGVAFREDSHFEFTRPLPVLRRSLLEIGRRLTDAGTLDDATDVFHLRLEELEALADPRPHPREGSLPAHRAPEGTPRAQGVGAGEVRGLVRARSARRDELAGVPLIDPFAIFPRRAQGDALLVGTPVGTGTATGPVTVIHEPAEFTRLRPGDVLVCPYTNPSWTPLFQIAAAVVVDAGGSTSHAAIVAREYGIPAVMGTADGTTVLHDGQRVTVDGLLGRVTAAPE